MKLFVLESRVVFDGALSLDVAEAFSPDATTAWELRAPHVETLEPDAMMASAVEAALTRATGALVRLRESEAELDALARLFTGGDPSPPPSDAVTAAIDTLLGRLKEGARGYVQVVEGLATANAQAAFALDEASGTTAIYVDAEFLLAEPSSLSLTRVLLEEIGHALDHELNGITDTKGDEGALFASHALGETLSEPERARLAAEDDSGALYLNGIRLSAEFSTAPVITNPGTINGVEDSVGISLFGAESVSAPESSTMEAIATVTAGDGTLSNGAASLAQIGTQGDRAAINSFLDNLVFIPDANWSGTATISLRIEADYTLVNGADDNTDVTEFSFDVVVAAVNDAPAGADKTLTINEDEPHNFAAGDFGFNDANDAPPNALFAVKITTLPSKGSLTLSGNSVSAGDVITAADIANLVFTPAANANGSAYTSFTFQVQDDGGAVSGTDLDPSANTITFNVTPVNDAPVTADGSESVQKNGIAEFALTSIDVDTGTSTATNAPVTDYKIVTLPTNGTLKHGSTTISTANTIITATEAADLSFEPATNFAGDASFTFTAIDNAGAESAASVFTITVTAVNFAPEITVPTAQTTAEETALSITGVSVADTDAATGRMKLTLSADHGTISLAAVAGLFDAATGGSAINAGASQSITVYGALADINTAIATLTYTPDTDFAGDDTITLTIDDLGNSDGDADVGNDVAKSDTATIAITVTNVDDAPITGAAILGAVNEDTANPPGAAISTLLSSYFDVDADTLVGIAISADASTSAQGSWQYSLNGGATWSAIGSVSASAALAIDAGTLLRFLPAANYFGTPGALTLHAIDNSGTRSFTSSSASPATIDIVAGGSDIDVTGNTLSTSITAVNDPLVIAADADLRVGENKTATLTSAVLAITDAEATAAHIVYTLFESGSILGDGVFEKSSDGSTWTALTWGDNFTQEDIDNGYVRYVHNGDEPLGTEVLAYTVTDDIVGDDPDSGGSTVSRTLDIKVSPINDLPVLYLPGEDPGDGTPLAAEPTVGGTFTFSTEALRVVDPDNTDEQLVFRLESLPTSGYLTFDNVIIGIGSTFSYAKLGLLKYIHTGTSAGSDSFEVTLRDGAGGVVGSEEPIAVPLTIGGENRAPTGIGNISGEIYEDPDSYGALANNDGKTLAQYSGYMFSDPDDGQAVGGYAIVGNDANASTEGNWQYSTDNGTTWADIGSVNDTTGALVLSPTTLVRFNPVTNYNGTPPALQIRALDNTYGGETPQYSAFDSGETRITLDVTTNGGSTSISGNMNTLTIRVLPVNDDPTLARNNDLVFPDGSTTNIATIGNSLLQATDPDLPGSEIESNLITFRVESTTSNGTLYMDGAALGVGGTFTQDDIDAGLLSYAFDTGTTATTDAFTFTVRDGGFHTLYDRPGGIYESDQSTLVVHTFDIRVEGTVTGTYQPPAAADIVTDPAPTISVQTLQADEGATGIISGVLLAVSDTTDGDTETPPAAISITLTSLPTGGRLYFHPASGSPIALRTGDTFTQADVDANRLRFSHNGGEDFITSFNFTARDGAGNTANGTFNIDITPVNDAPSFRTTGFLLAENASFALNQVVTNISDADGGGDKAGLEQAVPFADANTLTFTMVTAPTYGEIRILTGASYDPDDATTYTVADTQTAISVADLRDGKVLYQHDGSEYPSDSFEFILDDNQGQSNSTIQRSVSINISPLNDDPEIAKNTGATLVEADTVTITNSMLAASDPDNTATQLQFRITENVAHGRLELVDGSSVTVLGVGSRVTQAEIDAGQLRYIHDGSETTADAFDFTLSDSGGGNEPTGTFDITLTPVNDPPEITVPDGFIVAEDQDGDLSGISVSDPDAGASDLLTVSLSVDDGVLTLGSTTGLTDLTNGAASIGFTGTLADINAALATLSYRAGANYSGPATLSVTVNDNGHTGIDPSTITGLSDTGTATTEAASTTVAITVASVNDAPTITVPSSAQSVDEDIALVLSSGTSNAIQIADVDAGSGAVRLTLSVANGTLSVSGTTGLTVTDDGKATVIVQGTISAINTMLDGGVTYTPDDDYNGADTLTLTLNDLGSTGDLGGPQEVSETLAITVNPVNDAPTVEAIAVSATEDTPKTFTLTSSDVDEGNDATTDATVDRYKIVTLPANGSLTTSDNQTISAGDIITVVQATDMTFTPAANFNGTTSFTFTALDAADAESGEATVTITVAAVNDTPAISGAGDSVSYTEGVGAGVQGTPVKLDGNGDLDLSDVELTVRGEDTFNSATLRVKRSGDAVSTDRYWFDTSGSGDTAVSIADKTISVGGQAIGTLSASSATSDLRITFNASATKASVEAVMRAVTFASTDDDFEGDITVAMTFNDGNAGTPLPQGSDRARITTVSFTVTVINTNDAPSFTANGAISVAEDTTDPTGTAISTIFSDKFSDLDDDLSDSPLSGSSLAGIAIVGDASDPAHEGHWEYSTDGTNWHDVSPGGTAPTETTALVLSASTELRFVPVADFNSRLNQADANPGALSVRPIDDSDVSRAFTDGATRETADVTSIDASSDIGGTSETIVATVTQVNDAPEILYLASTADSTLQFTEAVGVNVAGTAVLLDTLADDDNNNDGATPAEILDIDLVTRGETTFSGARLVIGDKTELDPTDLFVVQTGTGLAVTGGFTQPGSGITLFNSGSVILYSDVVVAALTDNSAASGQLIVTFNDNATSDAVNAVLRNVAYSNSNAALTTTDKTIEVAFFDGNGSTDNNQGTGGELSATADIVIALTAVNDSPKLSGGATIATVEDSTSTPTTFFDLLNANLEDPDSLTGTALEGVAISGFDTKSLGDWQVNLGSSSTPYWVSLAILSTNAGGLSSTQALLLSASTELRFVPDADDNTGLNATESLRPTLTVHGVENQVPDGASNIGPSATAPDSPYTTDQNSPKVWDTTTFVGESRVSAEGVTVDLTIAARNDAPTVTTSGTTTGFSDGVFTGTVVESPVAGVGTSTQQLLAGVTVSDIDLATTFELDSTVFGAGTITVTLASRVAGDVFTLDGTPLGVASTTGGEATSGDFVITLTDDATVAQVNAILEAIRYEHTSDQPPTTERSYTITLNDGDNLDADGDTAGGPAALAATAITGSITITGPNDPPTLTATAANPDFTENGTAVTLFSEAAVDTIESGQGIKEIVIEVSGLGGGAGDGANEKLRINGEEIDLVAGATSVTGIGIDVTVSGTTATVTLTPTSPIDVTSTATLINGLAYRHDGDDPTPGDRVVTITRIQDDGGTAASGVDATTLSLSSTVNVISVNDAPAVGSTISGTFTEGDSAPVQFLSGITVSDIDAEHFNGGFLEIAQGTYIAGDRLEIVEDANYTLSGSQVLYNSAVIGTIDTTSDGQATALKINFTSNSVDDAVVQGLLARIGFSSTNENPTVAGTAPTRAITVTLNDGGNEGETGGAKSDSVTGTIDVVGINDAPTLTGLDATHATTYIQDGTPIAIDADALLADADLAALTGTSPEGNWDGSTLTLQRQTTASTDDVFGHSGNLGSIAAASGNVVVSGTTIGSYTQSGGVLTLTFNANATTALVNAALQSITYSNAVTTAGGLSYNSITLDVTFNDQNSNDTGGGTAGLGQDQGSGGALSVSKSITINIDRLPEAVNDTNSVAEGVATTDTTTTSGNVITGVGNPNTTADSDDDIEAGGRDDALSIVNAKDSSVDPFTAVTVGSTSATNGTDVTGDYGTLTIGADGSYIYAVDNTNGDVQALATGETLTDTFTYQLSDGQGGLNTADLTITITGTNDDPVISIEDGDNATTTITETNGPLLSTLSLTVSDVDLSNTVSPSVDGVVISGTYGGVGSLDNTTFKNYLATNFEFQAGLLKFTADNAAEVYLNGQLIGETNDWQQPYTFTGLTVLPGTNVLSVLAWDVGSVAAMSGKFEMPDGTSWGTSDIAGWKVFNADPDPATDYQGASRDRSQWILPDGWNTVAYDDSAWDTPFAVSDYERPWGADSSTRTGDPTWIWWGTDTEEAYEDGAYNTDVALFRYDFTGSSGGNALQAGEDTRKVNWTFDSSTEDFDYLAKGETIVLDYTITVSDSNSPSATDSEVVTVTIQGSNDTPDITPIDVVEAVHEDTGLTDGKLTGTGSLTFEDLDESDLASTTVALKSATTTGPSIPTALTDALETAVTLSGDFLEANSGTVTWDWALDNNLVQYLADGETVTVTYTISVTDDSGVTTATAYDEVATATQDVTITITGTNDKPVITQGDDTSALTETNTTITDTGTMIVTDIDVSDTIAATVESVSISGGSYTTRAGYDRATDIPPTDTELANMLSLAVTSGDISSIEADPISGSVFEWNFSSGDEGIVEVQKVSLVPNLLGATNKTFSIGVGSSAEAGVTVNSGAAGFSTATEMAAAFQAHPDYDQLPYVISADATDTALIITFKSPGDAATRTLAKWGDHGTLFTEVEKGVAANTSPNLDFAFLAKDETLELTYTVKVTDSSGANSGEATTDTSTVVVTITGTNDTPDITVVEVTGQVTEDDSPAADNPNTVTVESDAFLNAAGSVTFDDLDLTDTSGVTHTFVSATPSTGASVSTALDTALRDLTNTFAITGGGVGTAAQSGTVEWDFSLDNALTQYLSAGETVTVTYRITVTDDSGVNPEALPNEINARTQDVTITLTGANDAPTITMGSGNSDAETLTETDGTLTGSGTLTVADVDLTNTVAAQVLSVAASDTVTGLLSDNAALKAMMSVTPATPLSSTDVTGQLGWSFDSGAEAFDYLATGEVLTLTYTIRVTDTSGATADKDVTLTITGTNDAPVISLSNNPPRVILYDGLNATGNILLDTDVAPPPSTPGEYDYNAYFVFGINDRTKSVQIFNATATFFNDNIGSTAKETYGSGIHDIVSGIGVSSFSFVSAAGAADSNVAALDETDAGLTTSGTLTVGDIDLTDVATATRTLAVSGTSDRDDPAAPGDTALQAMLTLSPTTILDGTQQTNTLGWSFDSGSEAFDYLAKGETLILEYTVTATDDDGTPLSDSETVTITITGTNDTPDIIATKVTGAVTEDATSGEPAALRDSGSISFADVDTSDTSTVTVALTGTPATTGPAIPSSLLTALQTAVTLSGDTSGANDGSVNWAFALDNAEAQYLAAGETVTVTYTISVTDDSGVSTASGNDEIDTRTQAVTITITGTNDAPVLSDTALTLTQAEDDGAPSGAVGTLVSTLAGGIGETDTTNPAGIAITATDTNRGTWYFSTDDGASWTSFTATDATARLLLADVDTRLYFQPDPQWHGSIDPALTLRAWDGSSGSNGGTADLSGTGITGGTTAFSTATDTVALKINPVNDQPTISKTVTLAAVDEDTTPSGAGLATLDFGYSDVTDDQDDANTATLLGGDTSTPFTYLAVVGSSNYSTDQGVWQISTSATPGSGDWIDIPASGLSDSAALVFNASSLIRFIPAADFFGTPGTLSVRLADGSVDLSGAVSTAGSDTADLSTNGGTGTTGAWSASTQSIALAAVTNVNDRPTATATTLTATTEDNANPPGATVATLGFGYSDATDDQTAISGGGDEDTAFGGIAVVGNDADAATEGVWQYSTDGGLNWTAIGTPSETAALLLPTDAKLRFLPNVADYYGTPGALDVRVSDTAVSFSASSDISAALTETDQWSLATTLSTSVLPVNDAPTGSDKTITIDEDTTHTLTVADFGFVDAVEGDALASVVITSLATAGTLEYSSNGSSWDPVTLGQEISATDITAARLRFVPEAHANADSYASFTFQLRDDGGTTNGGVDLDPSANTITFNVRPVNDAPVATGTATLAAIDEDSTDPAGATVATLFTGNFSDATDNSVASIANTLAGIAITDYTPDAAKGLWQYSSDGSEWTDLGAVNAEASALTLAATDRLRFVPAANYNGAAPALTVKLIDSSTTVTSGATRDVSTSGGTTAFSASDVVLSHSVTPKLDLPVITTTATAASFTENGAAVAIDPALTITDVDDTHLTGATVTITSNLRAGDVLAVSGTASGLVSGTNITVAGYDPATGVLTLTGTETLANYQAVLRSVTFVNTSDNPNANSATDPLDREITFAVTDANADGAEMLTDPAELLVVYPFDDNTDGSDGFGTTLFDTDALIGSAVTKGPGLGIFEVGTDSWSGSVQVLKTGPGTSVTSAGPADALANDWYFEVTLTPEAAASMDIRSIAADWSRGGSTATRGWFVRASTDNFESDLYSNETPPGTPTGLQQAAFNIDGFTGLTEPVSFRFYIYTDSMGRYMDFQSLRFSDVALGIGSTTRAVAVTAVNDAPTLTGTLANPTVVENAGANTGSSTVALLSGSGVTDADFFTAGTNFGGGKITVSLTDGYVSGDTLDIASAELAAGAVQRSGDDIQYSADGTGWVTIGAVNATGTGQATDLVIDLNTDADQTNVAAVLDALSFRSTSDDPTLKGTDTTRAYSITLNDGNNDDLAGGSHEEGADSNALTGTITITAVNDTPVLAAITAGSVADAVNSSALGSQSGLSGTLDGSDVDTPSASLLYAISSATGTGATLDGITYDQSHAGTYGTLYLNTATGAYRYEPDAAAINTLHKGETQTDSFDLTLTDGALTTTAQSFTITLTGANEAAVLADTTDPAAIVETADASAQNIAVQSGSFALSDEDVGDTITASIHGNPVVRLNGTTLDPDDYPAELTAEGALSLTNTSQTSNGGALTAIGWSYDPAPAALDFVAAGETLTITYAVQVSDGTETGTQTVTVTLTGTNDTPEITVGDVTGAVTEDTTSGDPAALRDSGSISIADLDRSDTLTVDVALTGTPSTTGPAIPQSLQDALETAVTLSGATSGANAGSVTWAFALDTAEVQYLAAGETVTATYRITVTDDSGVSAASGEDEVNTSTQDVTITITGTNDAPVITDGPDTANLSETDAALTANGSLTVSDVDVTDVVGATAALSVSGTSDRDDPAAPSDEDLRAMFRVTPAEILDGTQTSASLGWVFDSGTEAFDYLATGETLVLTYTVTATDDDGTPLGDSETVTITITGTNDAPVITDGPDTASLNETDAALTTSGSLTVSDVDTTDVVGASAALAVSGTSDRADPAAPSDEDLLAMFRVAPAAILDGTQNAASLGWSFDSGTEAFDYLATGETLVLTYTVTATDDDGTPLSDDETVTITITGTNDGPLVTREPEKQVHPVNVVYETDLPAGFSDVDTSDRFTYSATGLPAGLSIDPVTGRISGTPSTAGSFKVIITADDGNGGSVSTRAYDFLIVAPPSETIGGTETQIRQQAETPLANRFDVPVTAQSAQISLPGSGAKSLVTDREPTETRDTRADAEVTPARLRIVNFILPAEDPDDADVVGRDRPGLERVISANLVDGAPLPTWLDFNAETRSFSGVVPPEVRGDIDIVVTYLDTAGSIKTLNMRIDADSLAISVSDPSDTTNQSDTLSEPAPDDEARIDWDEIEERLFSRKPLPPPAEQGGLRAQLSRIA